MDKVNARKLAKMLQKMHKMSRFSDSLRKYILTAMIICDINSVK